MALLCLHITEVIDGVSIQCLPTSAIAHRPATKLPPA